MATLHPTSSARLAPPHTQHWGHSPSELPVACWQPSVWVSISLLTCYFSATLLSPESCPFPWPHSLGLPGNPTDSHGKCPGTNNSCPRSFSRWTPGPSPGPTVPLPPGCSRGSSTPDWLLHSFLCLEPFEAPQALGKKFDPMSWQTKPFMVCPWPLLQPSSSHLQFPEYIRFSQSHWASSGFKSPPRCWPPLFTLVESSPMSSLLAPIQAGLAVACIPFT